MFTVGSTALPHRGKSDAFVLGLDGATGSPIWARSLGSTSDDSGADVAADALRVCAVGHGGAALRDTGGKTHAGSGTDGFVAYYYTTGQLQWVRRIGGSTGSDRTLGAAINSMGDCYAAGAFAGTMSAGTTSHTAPTYATNAYVLRVSASNKVTASLVLGAKKNDVATDVALAGSHVVVAGSYSEQPSQGPKLSKAIGHTDAFVLRLDADLMLDWYAVMGSANADHARRVAVDTAGRVVLVGQVQGDVKYKTVAYKLVGSADGFLARINTDGSLARFQGIAAQNSAVDALGVAAAGNSRYHVVGSYSGALSTYGLSSAGGRDGFWLRLQQP